jgi:dihydropyrimidinase
MSHDLILRNGCFVTPSGTLSGDLAVDNGKIAAIGVIQSRAKREIDVGERYVLPGGVDVHAHIEQMSGMGLMNADTFETATRSAAMGGTTTVVSFAAQSKGQKLSQAMADYRVRAARGAMIDHAFHIIVADTSVTDFASDLAALIADGHRSIKVFTTYNIRLSDADILRVMEIARRAGALVCVHAENDAMIGYAKDRLIAAGRTHPADHAASHPRLAEIEAVGRMIHFAELLGQPVMLFHISTLEALGVVRAARARGVPVWAETCPHYLLMSEDVLEKGDIEGAKWMCSPPQRTDADSSALWDGLADETLDLVSSDHAPYRFDETGKLSAGPTPTFDQIANGLPGLETRLPLMFDAMVHRGRGGIEAFARVTSAAPARIYGFDTKGEIAVGKDADLVIWDQDRTVRFKENDLNDNVGYNPWVGHSVTGWPKTVILRGEIIVADGVCHANPGQGQWLTRRKIGPQISSPKAILDDIPET